MVVVNTVVLMVNVVHLQGWLLMLLWLLSLLFLLMILWLLLLFAVYMVVVAVAT